MNIVDLVKAASAHSRPPARWLRAHRTHTPNEERSPEWNAWRERQALHPTGRLAPIGRRTPRPTLLANELQSRRASTRAKRRREHRAASLAQRDGGR
jgi:hypothetical protein